jgi:hypothetical protein
VDQEVAKTLGELELKLQELERELTSIGDRDTPAKPLDIPGQLIDEAMESVEAKSPPVTPPPPVTPSPPVTEERASLDVVALVGFRDKLARTMDELIEEYSRLLSLKPPS